MMTVEKAQAELARLDREIESREREIIEWEKRGGLNPEEFNHRYIFEFDFLPTQTDQEFPIVSKAVTVSKDTSFRVKSIGQSFSVVGDRQIGVSETIQATLNLSQYRRLRLFDYQLKISDTGSDREWQNDWIPAGVLLSGNLNEFQMREGHCFVSPASEISVQVRARFYSAEGSGLASISGIGLQIHLVGWETPYSEGK